MSIVVAYKYAPNPQDGKVGTDGGVDWSRAKASVSEYDPVAISVGRAIADTENVELIGISVGGNDIAGSMAKKNAMSKGFDRGVIVADDATADWNPTRVASALAALVRKIEDADLVLTGDSSIDDGAGMMSGLVAGFLGWPCFQEVTGVAKTDSGYNVTQRISGGTRTITVNGPVVVSTTSDAVEPKVASMKDILAAGKKPVEVVNADELTLADATSTITGRQKPATTERKHQIFTGENAPSELVAALRKDSVL